AGDEIADGIVQVHLISPLPARLHDAGSLALGGQVTERDTADAELAVEAARTTGDLTAIAETRRRGIARQLREREARGKPLFQRERFVERLSLQARTLGRVALRHLGALVIPFDGACLRHALTSLPMRSGVDRFGVDQFRNG